MWLATDNDGLIDRPLMLSILRNDELRDNELEPFGSELVGVDDLESCNLLWADSNGRNGLFCNDCD